MATIYAVPGLGTDERVFSKLFPLLEQGQHRCVTLAYLEPVHREESIADYAQRLVERLPAPQEAEPLVLLGFSLGGPIAIEMAKLRPDAAVILLSTFKQEVETPFIFKVARVLPLYHFVPVWYTHHIVPRLMRFLKMGEQEDRQLMGEMFRARSAAHFAWGRHAIVRWKNETLPANHWHVNGDRDHIFNSALPYTNHRIAGGTHAMLLDRAQEVATIVLPILQKIQLA